MNEISTTLYKVNWEYLINNCLNQNFWKNNWKVFEVDGITLTLTINQIDVAYNRIIFKLDGKNWDYAHFSIPLNVNHFNTEVFNKSLYNDAKRILEAKERQLIKKLPQYWDAMDEDSANNKARREEVRERGLEELFEGLTIDDLNSAQEEALDSYVSTNHSDSFSLANAVEEKLKHRHKPEWFGLLALTLGKQEDYDAWLKEQPGILYVDAAEDAYEHIEIASMEDME